MELVKKNWKTLLIAVLAILAVVFGILYIDGNSAKSTLEKDKTALQDQLKKSEKSLKDAQDEAATALQEAKDEAEKTLQQAKDDAEKALNDAVEAAKGEAATAQEAADAALQTAKDEAAKAAKSVQTRLDATQRREKANRADLQAAKKTIAELNEQMAAKDQLLEDAKPYLEGEITKQIDELTTQIKAKDELLEDAKPYLEGEITKQIDELNEQIKAKDQLLEDAKPYLEGEITKQIDEAVKAKEDAEKELKAAQDKVTELEAKVKELEAKPAEEKKEEPAEEKKDDKAVEEKKEEPVEEKKDEKAADEKKEEPAEEKKEEPAEEKKDDKAAEAAKVMTHEEYDAAKLESEVCVETFVQAKQGWWDEKLTVYAQSPDGAYFIFNMPCSQEDAEKLVPGTPIRVKGYKAEWMTEIEIMDATFEIIDGKAFIAEPEDVTDKLGTDDLIKCQNALVAFKGMTVEAQEDGSAVAYKDPVGKKDDLYFKVSKDGKTYDFCVESYLCGENTEVYKAVEALQVGDVIDAEGFLYWYNGAANPHITKVTKAK